MKIDINGFTVSITTEDQNLGIKVTDANGKELSNNTYSQKSTIEEPVQAPMPSVEETEETKMESFIPTFEEFKKSLKKA